MLQIGAPALIFINLLTVLRFWQDKSRAIAGEWRIPEAELLGLALIGGTPGAFLARYLFRHKTRKQPFSFYLMTIAVLQIGALSGILVFGWQAVWAAVSAFWSVSISVATSGVKAIQFP